MVALLVEIDRHKNLADGLGADTDLEGVLAIFLDRLLVLILAQQFMQFERGQAGLHDHVVLEVENALQVFQRHVQQEPDARR